MITCRCKSATPIAVLVALSLAGANLSSGGELKPGGYVVKPFSGNFERMAKLVGVWEGTKKDENGSDMDIRVEYRLTSGNSALTELLFKDSPQEMLSVYHDDGDGITMTHYCGLGNQPRMRATTFDGNCVRFDFVDGGNMASPDEPHMHALTMTLLDDNKIQHEWEMHKDGKKQHSEKFILTRIDMAD